MTEQQIEADRLATWLDSAPRNTHEIEAAILLREQAESINALTLALEVERDAANLYAKQVAHWIEKHDALLAQQLETVPQEWNDKNVIAWCVARGIEAARPTIKNSLTDDALSDYQRGYAVALSDAEEAIDDECRERVVTASDCIEIIRNLGEEVNGIEKEKP